MKCRSCKSDQIISILSLGEQYLSDFREDDVKPPKYPLDLMLCQNCYFVQLKESAPLSEMYTPRYGFKSGVNDTIRADLKDIVNHAKAYLKEKSSTTYSDIGGGDTIAISSPLNHTVIDIGANDGTLLSNFDRSFFRIGVEPITKLAKECESHADQVINDFFKYEKVKKVLGDRKADIITSISMFYDVEDPDLFVKEVAQCLDKDGVWVIQQNYLLATLAYTAVDNICHEHIGYHSLLSMEHLLHRHGLEVVDVTTSTINGGVIRTVVQFTGKGYVRDSVRIQREKELAFGLTTLAPYRAFEAKVKGTMQALTDLVKAIVEKGEKVYIYGASTRGGTIWQYAGLDHSLIEYAVERNPEKVGKKIAAIGVPIISEEEARARKPEYMFVSIWFFKEEILKREAEYLKDGGHLIFPLPELEVI